MVEVFFHGTGTWWLSIKCNDGTWESIPAYKNQTDYEVWGVFCLSKNDEMTYRHTKNLSKVSFLLPCLTHEDSEFTSRFRDVKDSANYYFSIDKQPSMELVPVSELVTSKKVQNAENPNKSELLAVLNQASERFWANADRSDKATWENNQNVKSWLQKRGFSANQAKVGASIIRPEWATSGRLPNK